MASERIQRRIDILLDEADEAVAISDWAVVRGRAQNVLRLDPGNQDALSYLAAAERDTEQTIQPSPGSSPVSAPVSDQPTSFANGHYEVKRFLGEGGKKKVYLAQDTLLDREVAFALIKTEGLDAELNRLGKPHQFYTYPGVDHAFMDFAQPHRYNNEAADASWPRTMEFFAQNLQGAGVIG